jgi:mannose-6-phosphate isomerase-like protein (cupin superfamily)
MPEDSVGKVNLAEKLASFSETWSPRIVGELYGQQVKLVHLEGEFVWHQHENEDELFLVLEGALEIELRDGTVALGEGEFYIVPRGVEHRPIARDRAQVLLFEPAATLNTGDVVSDRTVADPERI